MPDNSPITPDSSTNNLEIGLFTAEAELAINPEVYLESKETVVRPSSNDERLARLEIKSIVPDIVAIGTQLEADREEYIRKVA